VWLGKVSQQPAQDTLKYDGFSISCRADKWDADLGKYKAYLLEDEERDGCNVLLKLPKLPTAWAIGRLKVDLAGSHDDAVADRASLLTDGNVPPHFILLRFPPGMPLKNTFIAHQPGHRQIKRSHQLNFFDSDKTKMAEETSAPEIFLDHSTGIMHQTVRVTEKWALGQHLTLSFFIVHAKPVTRFQTHTVNDGAERLSGLFTGFGL
jgi:hypothetical protein